MRKKGSLLAILLSLVFLTMNVAPAFAYDEVALNDIDMTVSSEIDREMDETEENKIISVNEMAEEPRIIEAEIVNAPNGIEILKNGTPTDISAFLTIDESGKITGYSDNNTADILIPSVVNSKTVTAIGNGVFKNHAEIMSVQLPDTLETIGNSAFENVPMGNEHGNGSLTIPASVTSIGYNAFHGCNYMESVEFEDYTGGGEITPISFSEDYSMGTRLFTGCSRLTNITLSNRVKSIPSSFAESCVSLENVVWKSELTSIGRNAFKGDTALLSSDFSGTALKTIGNRAFYGCTSLPAPVFPEGITTIGDEAFCGALMGTKTETGNLIVPSSVDQIGYGAFWKCSHLGTVVFRNYLGDNLIPITFVEDSSYGSVLFSECPCLTKLTPSNRVSSIPRTFADKCTALETIEWNNNISSIGQKAFEGDKILVSSDISNTIVATIGNYAFNGCSSLPLVLLPETLTSIGDEAFQGTMMGTEEENGSLMIPRTVTKIGGSAFENCSYLGKVTFRDYVGPGVPAPITFGGNGRANTFENCPKLKEIILSDQTGIIPAGFAYNCKSLTTVKWPENLTKIGSFAFEGDISLVSSDFSKTELTVIEQEAFRGCSSILAVVFPETLERIGISAFENSGMGTESVPGEISIPSGVEYIGEYAFKRCKFLKKVNFGPDNGWIEGISIGGGVFYGCNNLEEIILSGRVHSIPAQFANECYCLAHVVIPDSVTQMGSSAFHVSLVTMDIVVDSNPSNSAVENYNWSGDNRNRSTSAVVKIELNKSELELLEGESERLVATIKMYPESAAKPGITWSSSNGGYHVSVEDGLVKALRAGGVTTITASTAGGSKNATCKVTVVEQKAGTYYSVEFNTLGGSPIPQTQKVKENEKAYEPEPPERRSYVFAGWYTDREYTKKWDFNNPVTSNVILYAKWDSDPNSQDENGEGLDDKGNYVPLSANQPRGYRAETKGEHIVKYCHGIPFWGKSKVTIDSFGKITIFINGISYDVTKIKINKKKHLFQITGIQGVDKKTVKAVKKATKGTNGLPFTVNPYYVKDTDEVVPKKKKDGSISSVKIKIFDKYYKPKKDEWSFSVETNSILFTGSNLDGSYKMN